MGEKIDEMRGKREVRKEMLRLESDMLGELGRSGGE